MKIKQHKWLISKLVASRPTINLNPTWQQGVAWKDPRKILLIDSPNARPTHYALMAAEDVTQVEKNRWFKDFKIQLIKVSKQDNYAELTEFLRALGAPAAAAPAATR